MKSICYPTKKAKTYTKLIYIFIFFLKEIYLKDAYYKNVITVSKKQTNLSFIQLLLLFCYGFTDGKKINFLFELIIVPKKSCSTMKNPPRRKDCRELNQMEVTGLGRDFQI